MSNITLIVPTYRNPKYLDLLLRSATENLVDTNNHILVIVDGFFEESKDILAKYPNVRYLELERNQGMQAAINMGVMQAETECVFVVNDDNVMPGEWDKRVLSVVHHMRPMRQLVLTVNQVEPTGPSMFDFIIRDFGQSAETFQYNDWIEYEKTLPNPGTSSGGRIFPFVMQKKHYLAMGGMDTFFNSPNICDWDFFLRLGLMGFVFYRTHVLHLYHFGSVSTKKNAESAAFRQREQQAMLEYEFKWGAKPHNEPGTNNKLPPDGKFRGFIIQ